MDQRWPQGLPHKQHFNILNASYMYKSSKQFLLKPSALNTQTDNLHYLVATAQKLQEYYATKSDKSQPPRSEPPAIRLIFT